MRKLLPVFVALAGCPDGRGITETGNPEMAMAFRARTSAPSEVTLDGGDAPIGIDAVWVSIDDVRFVQGEVCDAPGEIEHDAPGVTADLLSDPDPVRFEVAEADYCRVRVRFDRADDLPPGAPPELEDASLVVTGTRDDGTPFVIVSRETPEADVRSRSEPFALSEARDRLVMAFDVAAWLEGVDLDAATVTGGRVLVDDDHNEELLEAIEDRIEAAMALYDDVDGSGSLDDDEDDEALASGS